MTTGNGITVNELRDLLARGERLTILDVRPSEERAEWSIPGSLHINAYERLKAGDEDVLDEFHAPDDGQVVTVCAAGRTSLIAADLLRRRGVNAISLAGGMKAWSLAWNTATFDVPGSAAQVIQVRRTGKGCLSYVVGAGGKATVIDASLDPDVYLDLAAERGWTITNVLDTHIHADHLSRARMLADRANATLYLPAQDRVDFSFEPLQEGDTLGTGSSRLHALAVPGHTNESMAYLLDGRVIFTGDTLFLTAVGRPDLEASVEESRIRAQHLYRSLTKLAGLSGDTVVMPAHTSEPIAFDGEPIAATLADVMSHVDSMRLSEDAFVDYVLSRIPPTPPNHSVIVRANESGELPQADVTDLEAGANRCAVN